MERYHARKSNIGLIAFLFLSMAAACAAEETAVLRQDFENRLPGQIPEGWTKTWGGPLLEDVFTTSNTEALSGKQSLLLERRLYEKPGMYGLARLTAPINASAAKLTIPFLIKAPTAYGASFSILLRSTKSSNCNLAELRVAGGKAIICRGKKDPNLGSIEFGVWHRFVVVLPLDGEGENASVALERRQKDGSWTPSGDKAEVDVLFPLASDRRLSIQFVHGMTGEFQLFLDDLSVETVSELKK